MDKEILKELFKEGKFEKLTKEVNYFSNGNNAEDAIMQTLLLALERGEEISIKQLKNRAVSKNARQRYKEEGLTAHGKKRVNIFSLSYDDKLDNYGYDEDGKLVHEFIGEEE